MNSAADAAPIRAVLFDFYGTLGESDWDEWWIDRVLGARGLRLDREVETRWSANAWDGLVHEEHSMDKDTYNAWSRWRWEQVLLESGVPHVDLEEVLGELEVARAEWEMRLYPEVPEVLRELRRRGVKLAVCSNWDWDLDRHLIHCGLEPFLDARISSAWVGARKPHPRIFHATLSAVGACAAEAIFVGDNWIADVEGPRAVGIRAVHVWRHEEHPGDWLPEPPPVPDDVVRLPDLRRLPELL